MSILNRTGPIISFLGLLQRCGVHSTPMIGKAAISVLVCAFCLVLGADAISGRHLQTSPLVGAAQSAEVVDRRDDSRVKIEEPDHKLQLAVPNQVLIHVASGEVKEVIVEQANDLGEIPDSGAKVKVTAREGDVRAVEVRPMRLGEIKADFMVRFEDGAFAMKSVKLDVEPPETPPAQFHADKHDMRVLTFKNQRSAFLEPSAKYEGITFPIPLDWRFVQYRVVDQEPVIRLHDGQVEAIREGESTLEGRYCGLVSTVRVVVKQQVYR